MDRWLQIIQAEDKGSRRRTIEDAASLGVLFDRLSGCPARFVYFDCVQERVLSFCLRGCISKSGLFE